MQTTTLIRCLIFITIAGLSAPAMAVPNILGTWSGSGTWEDKNCSDAAGMGVVGNPLPAQNGSGTETIIFTIDSQSGSSFSGHADDDGTATFSGTIAGNGSFSGTFNSTDDDGTKSTGSISGSFNTDNNTASLEINGYDTVSPGGLYCDILDNFTVLRDSSVIADPAAAPSNAVISNAQTLATSVSTTTGFLGTRIQAALSGGHHAGFSRAGRGYMLEAPASGLAAGDTFENLGMWASYAHTKFDNDFFRTKYDGDTNTFFVGADFTPRDNMVLGLAIGYEKTDIDTDFNLGQADVDGYTFAPYFGMTLDDTWNIDASAGYSVIDTDQYRTTAGTRITSDVKTQRWFFAANINGFTSINRWNLSGRAGAMVAKGTDEKFTESNGAIISERMSEISQFSLGGEAAYGYSDEFEPFIGATYNYDMTKTETQFTSGKQPSSDDDDFLLSFGFRYFAKSGLTVSAQYDTRQGRDDYDEDTLSATLRWDF